MKIKLFADGADYDGIVKLAKEPIIKGFTTNPSLCRKSGVKDYAAFARSVLASVTDKPVSFEIFADDFPVMAEQARTISGWGKNVYVKIPVSNCKGMLTSDLIRELSSEGIKLNVTAVFTHDQVRAVATALDKVTPSIISVFAGRIADTGADPVPHMRFCKDIINNRGRYQAQLLWASTREFFNIWHAEEAGCDLITVPNDILTKLDMIGKDLKEYSRETVQMFHRDATAAGYAI